MTPQNLLFSAALSDQSTGSFAQIAHTLLRMTMALRYRKNLVIAIMVACSSLGVLYYMTASRQYSSKAVLLVSLKGPDHLDTSVTNDKSMRQNTMPTFESMVRSAKVLEGALQRLAPQDRIDLEKVPRERWLLTLQKRLSVETVRTTSILQMSYRSQDPQVAANVIHAIVNSYLDFMDEIHKGATGRLSQMLTQERGQLVLQLNQKQAELLDARRRFADMGFRGDGKTLHPLVQRAVFFNDSLIAVQKQRADLEALLASLEDAIRNGRDIGQYLVSVADVVGRELLLSCLGLGNSDTTTQTTFEQDLLNDQTELNSLQQNLGPAHPAVVALAERVRRTQQYLQTTQARLAQRVAELQKSQLGPWLVRIIRQRLQEAWQREQRLQARFEQTRSAAIDLSSQLAEIEVIEHDLNRLSDMNDALQNQIASADVQQNGSDVRVALLEEPVVAKQPVSPRASWVAAIALAGGFALALFLVNALDALDDRFRSPEELQSRLGLPVLSTIRHMTPSDAPGIEALITFRAPTDAATEGFRTLRTSLSLTHPDAHRLVVSSSEPADGKTTILANLAVCYAQAEKKTLLIDADLRRPGLTTLLNLRGPKGLSEVLRSEGDIAQVATAHIQHSAQEGLDILPSGPRPSNPAELLGSPRLSELLAWAETVYDQVLVDSPPILATTDTAIVGRLIDGALLVVRPSKNHRHTVLRAAERLQQMHVSILGVVVNGVDANDDHGYGYYGYHGYYGGYEETSGAYSAEEPAEDPAEPHQNRPTDMETDILSVAERETPTALSAARIVPRRVA